MSCGSLTGPLWHGGRLAFPDEVVGEPAHVAAYSDGPTVAEEAAVEQDRIAA